MYRKGSPKQTANASCTEGSSSIPKLLALESSYWYADEVANVPVRILQITCWCLASTQLKEHKPGYVPFCLCQALYRRVLRLLWLTSTNLFLAAFFHKLLIPLRLQFIAGGSWSSCHSLTSYGCFQTSAESRSGIHHSFEIRIYQDRALCSRCQQVLCNLGPWFASSHLSFPFCITRVPYPGLAAKTAEPWY